MVRIQTQINGTAIQFIFSPTKVVLMKQIRRHLYDLRHRVLYRVHHSQ